MASAVRPTGRIDFAQQSTNYERCLAKWAYGFSYANAPLQQVAEAAAEACDDAVQMRALAFAQLGVPDDKIKTLPEPDAKDARESAIRRALFYAVAGRAGKCDQKKD